jgi:hypothetical protein
MIYPTDSSAALNKDNSASLSKQDRRPLLVSCANDTIIDTVNTSQSVSEPKQP